jgi:hypothetical protein
MYKNVPENKQEEFHNRVQLAQAPLSVYKCPATAEDYWVVVDNYWSYLLAIIERFGPPLKLDEMLLGSEILSVSVAATRWKENRDIRLVEYFNDTWAAAPDCGTIHMIPGWHILCDLCSESYLFYGDSE